MCDSGGGDARAGLADRLAGGRRGCASFSPPSSLSPWRGARFGVFSVISGASRGLRKPAGRKPGEPGNLRLLS
jgi:hypothetical protein